jgi:Lrp/AsnC family transcriptional regulator for asnA, asnC and gidA
MEYYSIMKLDEKDLKVLKILKENSKLTTNKISKKTAMPITTVHNRIKKLEKLGVIKEYTIVLDHKKLGKNLSAYILVTVDYKLLKEGGISQYELAKQIKKHDFVEETAMVTGGTDIIVKVRANDIEHLSDFVTKELRNIDGIERTQTMVVLSEI